VAWLVVDQPGEARAQLGSVAQPLGAGQTAQLSHYYELLSAAQIDLYEGDAAGAHARLAADWPAIEAALLTRIPSVRVDGGFMRARAALALAALDAGQRPKLLALAAELARRLRGERLGWGMAFAAAVRAGVARVSGDRAGEERELREALERFRAVDMSLYAAAVARRLAVLIGGDEGTGLAAAADEAFRTQAIPNPTALCRLMLGFGD
jgi:hypothetical protein